MNQLEVKLLLKLLSKSDNRLTIGQINLGKSVKEPEKQKIARALSDRFFIDITEEIALIKVSDAGKTVLKAEVTASLATKEEVKILEAAAKEGIKPSAIKAKSAKVRDELIATLIDKGFLAAEKRVKEVTLTQAGKDYLATEYLPTGTGNVTLSGQMLTAYLRFLRSYYSSGVKPVAVVPESTPEKTAMVDSQGSKPSDEEILQGIKDLDRELGTDNYLPIFHLRSKFQPPLTRDELDQAIYRLQKQRKLKLSSLVEAIHYTNEQIQAGITQEVGGPLFFLVVK